MYNTKHKIVELPRGQTTPYVTLINKINES